MSIAPTLRRYVMNGEGDPYQLEKTVRAELRALLAGANAIARHIRWLDVQHKREGVKFETVTDEGLRRAFARLARLSSPGRRRRKP